MDRRDALKKMAATGVVVSGASAIVSSTAFADGGTTGSQPPTGGNVTFTATNSQKFSVPLVIDLSGIIQTNCPSGGPARIEYRIEINTLERTAWTAWPPLTNPSFTLNTGSYEVVVTVRWVCGNAWKCESYVADLSASNSGGRDGTITLNGQSTTGNNASLTSTPASSGSGAYCNIDSPS